MEISSLGVFILLYVFSYFFVLGFDEWFLVWMGLEVNMMSFLSVMNSRGEGWKVESLYSYFFIQSAASGMFLIMVYVGGEISFVLMMKLAVGPFYFWLPGVMKGLDWISNLLLVSVQKVMPLVMLVSVGGEEVVVMGMVSMIVGMVGSFSQSDLSMMMAYSSVNHVGWMVVVQKIGVFGMWMMYFLVYFMLMVPIMLYLNESMMDYLSGNSSGELMLLMFMMLNMVGMPPLLGFMMKWVVLSEMIFISLMVSITMILTSLVMFYVYVRVFYEEMLGGGEEVVWMSLSSGRMMVFLFYIIGSLFFPLVVLVI